MSLTAEQSGTVVLQLLQARQMFIGDELRVSSLRVSWMESGHDAESFSLALSELQKAGLIRTVHGTSGPAVQLTHQGFRATAHPTSAAKPAAPVSRQTTVTTATQAPKPRTITSTEALAMPIARPAAKQATAPAAVSDATTRNTALTSTTIQPDVAHARVFRTREEDLNDNVLKHCLLGLMQHYRIRANGFLSYGCITAHWTEMGLSKDDLVYTLDLLLNKSLIRTVSEPKELVILTPRGFELNVGAPSNLDDGMDRWRAKKRLRLTKQLGCLPAA